MRKTRNRKSRMACAACAVALALACAGGSLTGCASARGGAETMSRTASYEEVAGYLNLSRAERRVITAVSQTDVYRRYVALAALYEEQQHVMGLVAAAQSKVGQSYREAFDELMAVVSEQGFSAAARVALFTKAAREAAKE